MIIPKKLKIGGHKFTVDCSKQLDNVLGDTDYSKNLIRISKDLPQDQKESVLIHEIFHAMNSTVSDGFGHVLIDSFAEQFYQVLKDNKLIG